jgi:hypothetical protein
MLCNDDYCAWGKEQRLTDEDCETQYRKDIFCGKREIKTISAKAEIDRNRTNGKANAFDLKHIARLTAENKRDSRSKYSLKSK